MTVSGQPIHSALTPPEATIARASASALVRCPPAPAPTATVPAPADAIPAEPDFQAELMEAVKFSPPFFVAWGIGYLTDMQLFLVVNFMVAPLFITFSPDEKHNVLMVLISRSRTDDPDTHAGQEQPGVRRATPSFDE